MTRSRYSVNEALNRILRTLEGNPLTADTPGVIPGEVLSHNDALSDLAELLEGSLPNQTLSIPYSGLPFASVDEANAGTETAVVLSPASHSWAHEFGGIYASTGTSIQAFTASTWTKLTGTFQNYMDDSGAEIDSDWNDDRIVINEAGTYLVTFNLSMYTNGAAKTTVNGQIYSSGTAAPQTMCKTQFIVTGSYANLVGTGEVVVPTTGWPVDIRLNPSASITIQTETAQLMVQKMVG